LTDPGLDVDALDALLDRTRQALNEVSVDLPGTGSSLQAEGAAAGALVQATVSPNQVESVRIDPRAMRLGSTWLAAQVNSAINAAFAELRQVAGLEEVRREAQARAAAVSARLQEAQDDSMRSMARIASALTDAAAQFGRGRA
jgi:hypothetical protein